MLDFENQVKNAVEKSKQIVDYTVTPVYDGKRTVPYEYKMDAVGVTPGGQPGIDLHREVPNKIYSVKYKDWYNLGRVDYYGPVPTGGMG